MVEQCGGSVELESVEREGTVVTVSLPPVRRMCVRQDQYELKGAVLEAPLEWQGLRLAPGRGGVLVTGLEGTDQRRFQRQLTVLKGYAALAADRRGERPLRLRQEDLPEREGPETLAAVS